MTMELLEGDNIEENIAETTKWSAYIDSYTSEPVTGMDVRVKSLVKPVFLNRNVATGQRFHANKTYPPEITKMFSLETEDVKPLVISPNPEKPVPPKRAKIDGSSKFMLSQTLTPV